MLVDESDTGTYADANESKQDVRRMFFFLSEAEVSGSSSFMSKVVNGICMHFYRPVMYR